MLNLLRPGVAKAVLTLALLIGLAATGFAHKSLQSDADRRLAETAATLGMTLADLCGDTGTPDDRTPCPACRLTLAALLPAPSGVAHPARLALRADPRVALLPAAPRRPDTRAGPTRAPPVA